MRTLESFRPTVELKLECRNKVATYRPYSPVIRQYRFFFGIILEEHYFEYFEYNAIEITLDLMTSSMTSSAQNTTALGAGPLALWQLSSVMIGRFIRELLSGLQINWQGFYKQMDIHTEKRAYFPKCQLSQVIRLHFYFKIMRRHHSQKRLQVTNTNKIDTYVLVQNKSHLI